MPNSNPTVYIKFFITLFCLHAVYGVLWGQDPAWASSLQSHEQTVRTIYKKNKNDRSIVKIFIEENKTSEGSYTLRLEGQGSYKNYENARWISRALFQFNRQGLNIQNSATEVYSKDALVYQSKKKYDYTTQEVSIEITNLEKKTLVKEKYPIKGPICDDVTLVPLFTRLIPLSRNNEPLNFFLVTDEPKLYHVIVKHRGEETLKLPSGEYKTDQYQLMADLGPLTDLAGKVVAPTYIWISRDNPQAWLQYEGLETGYETTNIISYVVEIPK